MEQNGNKKKREFWKPEPMTFSVFDKGVTTTEPKGVMDIVGGSLDGMLGILGAYLIFMFIEFVALVARVVMLAKPGMVGMNEYGADPIRYIQ